MYSFELNNNTPNATTSEEQESQKGMSFNTWVVESIIKAAMDFTKSIKNAFNTTEDQEETYSDAHEDL